MDLIQEEMIALEDIEICILDEADRMCDMGFAPQVTQILELLTKCKQMLLFSATLPKELSEMMNRFCPDPMRIQVDAADKSSETIQHQAVFCVRKDKIQKLAGLISPDEVTALVFTRTRNGADALYRALERKIRKVGILHAGFSMGDRERTIRAFREGDIRVLIATDVVSRGIDIDCITHVIHYDLPDSFEDYIHRSGRSGRAGRAGLTIAFFERDNMDHKDKFAELKKKVQFQFLDETPDDQVHEDRPQTAKSGPRDRSDRPHRGGERSAREGGQQPRREGQRSRAPKRPRSVEARATKPTASVTPKKSSILAKTKKFFGSLFSGR